MYAIYHEQSHVLKSCEDIMNYIKGGRGVLTLASPSGKHHSYSFRRPRNEKAFQADTYFAYVMCDHGEWRYVGMFRDGYFRLTYNSEYNASSEEFKGAKYIVSMASRSFETPMTLYHEGVCACCGRRLTDPKSIKIGIGPTCFKTYFK